MISITRLLCGKIGPYDSLRYERGQISHEKRSPIIVWNITNKCNLLCAHCYINASEKAYKEELNTKEAMSVIDDLAEMKVPFILFSGGEPLLREDVFTLGRYAVSKGLTVAFSSNGTLITPPIAKKIKETGFHYVGISLDGMREINNAFRGSENAFERAIVGIRSLNSLGVRVGIRFTMFKKNAPDIPKIFKLLEDEKISRLCFYHLVYTGRGTELRNEDFTSDERRKIMDTIFEKTQELFHKNPNIEILTVDNHVDGAYLYLKTLKTDHKRAELIMKLLIANGGSGSGTTIGCIDYKGNVHADQFWSHYSFGNVRERPFSKIWFDTSDELMLKLKDKKKYLKGRCSKCVFLETCGGASRVRAEAIYGDTWAPDPSCYLTDAEISQKI